MDKKQKMLIMLAVVFAAVFLVGIFIVIKAETSMAIPFWSGNIAGILIAIAGGTYLGIVLYLLGK